MLAQIQLHWLLWGEKNVKAQIPFIIVQYLHPSSWDQNQQFCWPEKHPLIWRTSFFSYLISTNQCHELSVLHKLVLMPWSEPPIYQEDCISCQKWKLSTVVNVNLEPRGSSSQYTKPLSFSYSERQDSINDKLPSLADYMLTELCVYQAQSRQETVASSMYSMATGQLLCQE